MPEVKHITILINSLAIGGAEKQSVMLARALSQNFPVSLVVYNGHLAAPKLLQLLEGSSVNLVRLTGHGPSKVLKTTQLLRQAKTSIIFSYLLTSNLLGAICGKLAGTPLIIGGIRNSVLSSSKINLERFLHKHIHDHTIFNNYSGKKEMLSKGFLEEKSTVITNCIQSVPDFKVRAALRTIHIIMVARFVPQKDHNSAILSIKLLTEKFNCNHIKVSFIGYGAMEDELRQRIANLKMENIIKVVVQPDNLEEYYAKADIFLLTSKFEGFSNALMEAVSYGLPVVATQVGDNDQLVKDGESGFLCPVSDHEQIASKLNQLIQSHALRMELGEKGHKNLQRNFSVDKLRSHYIDFITTQWQRKR